MGVDAGWNESRDATGVRMEGGVGMGIGSVREVRRDGMRIWKE